MSLQRIFAFLACLGLSLNPLRSQTTFATVTGTITDPAGASIPEATVTATHLESNYTYTAESNATGNYVLPQLREGTYQMKAEAKGFNSFVSQNFQIMARDVRRIDIQMQLGAVASSIDVSSEIALIETETTRIGDTRGAEALKSLPLNDRSMYSFLQQIPGMLVMTGGNAYIRFAGSRGNQENESIDGISFNNLYDGSLIGPLADFVESVQEMRVDLANNTAEFGALGQVTLVSKSGTNQIHGSAFDYYSTAGLNARNPFAMSRSSFVRHWPGASVGGPIFLPKIFNGKNKSFFFFSYETMQGGAIQDLLNPTVPLPSWREGDFSALLPGAAVRDPFNGNAPFAGNRIPASRINTVSKKIQDRFYPLPNTGRSDVLVSQNFNMLGRRAFDPDTLWTTRIDHRFNENSTIFGRYTWERQQVRPWEGNLPTIGQRWQQRDTRGLNVSWSRTIRPNLLNELRGGISFNDNPRQPPTSGKQLVSEFGLVGLIDNLPDIPGIPKVNFSGVGITPITVSQEWRHPGFRNRVYQVHEQLNWLRGKHTVKMGDTISRVGFGDGQANASLFGNMTFSNRFTGQPYADFLLGIPTTVSRAFPPLEYGLTRWGHELFITDDFKVTQRLTLNLGLRYEYKPSWKEDNNMLSMFDIGTGKIVVPDGALSKVSPLMPRGYVDVIEAGKIGLPNTLLKTDKNNFAPRLGLAWRPLGNNTVFRSAFGIYYDVVPRTTGAGGVPFLINEPAYTNPQDNPTAILPRVFPTVAGGVTTVGLPTAIRPDLRVPYSMQYNLTIEHQRWDTGFRLSYVGTNTRQGEWAFNINQPLPDNRPYIDKPRMFPQYPSFNYLTNGGGHQYHSLTFDVKRRMVRGLLYQFSYQLARDIGDLERGQSPENAYDRKRERGVWLDVPTHRVTGSFIYQLPVGSGRKWMTGSNRWAQALFGGWEISSVFSYYSGRFITPLWTGPDPTGTAYTTSRTPANVTIRPDILRNPNLPGDQQQVRRWFDTTAFAAPRPGNYGTSAKGVIKGPGLNVLNGGLSKYFAIYERMRLRCEITSTNAFNHPNYSEPGLTISSPDQLGVISGVGGVASYDQSGPRTVRMGVRVEW
ncbi:MAG: carboxypeptidase regulatory-like domain-containing protein [Bryobacterales bacterium]|nr:carboxypeptidase regulatory-like domain-containing protein [Bryobacterales bacterium]